MDKEEEEIQLIQNAFSVDVFDIPGTMPCPTCQDLRCSLNIHRDLFKQTKDTDFFFKVIKDWKVFVQHYNIRYHKEIWG